MAQERIAKRPWNNWFHCMGSTYGAWIRGDPRGWRSRKHKIHVPYDYKSPPPQGAYDRLHSYCKFLMKRDAVVLTPTQRKLARDTMIEALTYHDVEVIVLCVSPTHFHILCRFTPPKRSSRMPAPKTSNPSATRLRTPRHLVGIAKKVSARALSDAHLCPQGGVWAVRCKCKPIRDRRHQLRVVRYIRAHTKRGAAVWTLPIKNRQVP